MKKSLIIIFFVFILISTFFFLSAATHNTKEYEKDVLGYGKISVLGSTNQKLAEYILSDNSDQCFIDCYAEGIALLYTDGYLFTDLRFKNDKNELTNINFKSILIEITESYEINVNDYQEVCEDKNINGTIKNVCNQELMGSHKETKYRTKWTEYNNRILSPGTYKWRIEGEKNIGENIDWIASAFGVDFTEWAWWNSSWMFKKPMNFSVTGHSTIADFQAFITLPWNQSFKNDFSDLRFTNAAEDTELAYYIDSKTDGVTSDIWIRLLTNVTTTNQTLAYMYYNNSGATSKSNNYTTFPLFDDFDATNSSAWTAIVGSQTVSGGKMIVDNDWIQSRDKFGLGYAYDLKLNGGTITDGQYLLFPRNSQIQDNEDDGIAAGINCNKHMFVTWNEGTDTGNCLDAGVTYTNSQLITIAHPNSSWAGLYLDNVFQLARTTNVPDEQLNFSTRDWDTGTYNVDWVRVRAWNDTTVEYSLGVESRESNLPTIPVLSAPANNSNFAMNSTITFSWNNSIDIDGDTITYDLEIYNESDMAAANLVHSNTSIAEGTDPTSINITLSDFTTTDDDYYWRVRANDSVLASNWSETRQFQYANWTITFNLTDSFGGLQIDTSGQKSFDVSCDNGFSDANVENPYTSIPADSFAAGTWECTFSDLIGYFDKTQNIVADSDKTIEISMQAEDSLTPEEHGWLEELYDCVINGNCDAYDLWNNTWKRISRTDTGVITQETFISNTLNSTSNITLNYTIDIPFKAGYASGELLPLRMFFWFTDVNKTQCYNQDKGTGTNRAESPYCLPLVAETLGPNNGTVTFTVDLRPSLADGNYNITRSIEIDPIVDGEVTWTNYGQENIGQVKVEEQNDDPSINLNKLGEIFPSTMGITGAVLGIGSNILSGNQLVLMFTMLCITLIVVVFNRSKTKLKLVGH